MFVREKYMDMFKKYLACFLFLGVLFCEAVAWNKYDYALSVSVGNVTKSGILEVDSESQYISTINATVERRNNTNSNKMTDVYFSIGYPYKNYFKPSPPYVVDKKLLRLRRGEKSASISFALTRDDLTRDGEVSFGSYRFFTSLGCDIEHCSSESDLVNFKYVPIYKRPQ